MRSDDDTRSAALKAIRRESTDAYNRLQSIAEDATFVSSISQSYHSFRVYPNLRCGAWYVDPKIAQSEPVYFKSTDGHFGQWGFNLRRANLHLLDAVPLCDGIILVDSTRRGKRLPDALSKTIPIWCAVINLAVAKGTDIRASKGGTSDTTLYTPPGAVSRSEHIQIESRLDGWAEQLLASEFSIPPLKRPLRPIWITPSTTTLPPLDSVNFFPVVCVSASKLVDDGIERRSAGFSYVQGSGDDHESWSQGLAPHLYWQNRTELLSSSRKVLLELISSLVTRSSGEQIADGVSPVPVTRVDSRLSVGVAHSLHPDGGAYVVITPQPRSHSSSTSPNILFLEVPKGKKGQYIFLAKVLPQSLDFVRHRLSIGQKVSILCEDGKDVSVGVAVAALSLFFDDEGNCLADDAASESPTKQSIHKRLQWVLANNPRANPSRTTLKRVHEFLMSPPQLRRSQDAQEVIHSRNDISTPAPVL